MYYNVIQMEEVLTLRLPKGSRRRLTQLAKRKRQNLSQYVRDAIESEDKETPVAAMLRLHRL